MRRPYSILLKLKKTNKYKMPFHIFNQKLISMGTQDPSWCDEVVSVARPNVLGNPFLIDDVEGRTREIVIDKYHRFLAVKFNQRNPIIMAELKRLGALDAEGKNVALVCWCDPLPCHASIVAKAAVAAHVLSEPENSKAKAAVSA